MQGRFGETVAIGDIQLLQEDDLPKEALPDGRASYSTEANPLWEYNELGSIGGIRVRESDLGLPIDSTELLENAFELHAEPKVFITWLSPDCQDGIAKYEALLKRAGDKEIVVSSEDRQFDPSKSAFLVLVRYDEIEFRLHKRFDYLHEER